MLLAEDGSCWFALLRFNDLKKLGLGGIGRDSTSVSKTQRRKKEVETCVKLGCFAAKDLIFFAFRNSPA